MSKNCTRFYDEDLCTVLDTMTCDNFSDIVSPINNHRAMCSMWLLQSTVWISLLKTLTTWRRLWASEMPRNLYHDCSPQQQCGRIMFLMIRRYRVSFCRYRVKTFFPELVRLLPTLMKEVFVKRYAGCGRCGENQRTQYFELTIWCK